MTTAEPQIAIFWDYENCRPPSGLPGNRLADNIRRLVQNSDPIKLFKAYVDISLECVNPRLAAIHSELQSSGVTLIHCPHNGKKDVADKMMIVDMLAFAIDNPPPVTMVIITGDRDFAYAAAILKLRGYKVTVITPPNMGHISLKMQADDLFDWQKDVTRTNNSEVIDSECGESIVGSKGGLARKDEGAINQSVQCPSDALSPITVPKPAISPRQVYSQAGGSKPADCFGESELTKQCSPGFQPNRKLLKQHESDIALEPGTRASGDSGLEPRHATIRSQLSCQLPAGSTSDVSGIVSPSCYERVSSQTALTTSPHDDINGVDVVQCLCKICTRAWGALRNQSRGTCLLAVEHADAAIPSGSSKTLSAKAHTSVNSGSSIETPSEASSELLSTNGSSTTNFGSEYNDTPSISSIVRFQPLIDVFIEQRAHTSTTELRSSFVASVMLKRDPKVYQKAGVRRMKQYVEEARLANVIVTPNVEHGSDDWIEINDSLYPDFKPIAHAIFIPLVNRLRSESPSYQLLDITVETFFKTEHPDIYQRAEFTEFTQYLQKAVKHGIVCLRKTFISDLRWVELVPALRVD